MFKSKVEEISALEEGVKLSTPLSSPCTTTTSTNTSASKSKAVGTILLKKTPTVPHIKNSGREQYKDVNHFFLIKRLCDDDDEGLSVVGTMIQMVFGLEDGEVAGFEHFPYCFNEEDAEDYATLSRTSNYLVKRQDGQEPIPMKWSKFIVKAPLDLVIVLDCFPFKILKASLTIELNAVSTDDGFDDIRPNMLLHTKDTRNNVSLVEPKNLKQDKRDSMMRRGMRTNKKNSSVTKAMSSHMDQSKTYDLVSPYPEVRYLYDTKKKNCTTLEISFYVIEGSIEKLLRVTIPMLLIATMNTMNVFLAVNSHNAEEEADIERIGGSDFLANSATFALTAVFLLPDIFQPNKEGSNFFSMNNMNILTIFTALGLSSMPYDLFQTDVIQIVGMYLLWASFLFPMYNTRTFLINRRKLYRKLYNQKGQFVKDTEFKGWYPAKNGCYFEDFKDVMEMNNENDLYSTKESVRVGERYISVKYDDLSNDNKLTGEDCV